MLMHGVKQVQTGKYFQGIVPDTPPAPNAVRQGHINGAAIWQNASNAGRKPHANAASPSAYVSELSPRPSVGLCVCRSVWWVICGKMAKWIRIPCGMVPASGLVTIAPPRLRNSLTQSSPPPPPRFSCITIARLACMVYSIAVSSRNLLLIDGSRHFGRPVSDIPGFVIPALDLPTSAFRPYQLLSIRHSGIRHFGLRLLKLR